ncbi:hypothetical protein M0811_07648 [Anaeramoeba ignava]|uniref:Uncharacterized protein n=1 Tax=Anaeramoeba ignava TaxID=1746090 RepID=A0A9Q0LM65_ANAIG|nr:hypothetical protein M0811_07648 [Anaeramoeba ignava]
MKNNQNNQNNENNENNENNKNKIIKIIKIIKNNQNNQNNENNEKIMKIMNLMNLIKMMILVKNNSAPNFLNMKNEWNLKLSILRFVYESIHVDNSNSSDEPKFQIKNILLNIKLQILLNFQILKIFALGFSHFYLHPNSPLISSNTENIITKRYFNTLQNFDYYDLILSPYFYPENEPKSIYNNNNTNNQKENLSEKWEKVFEQSYFDCRNIIIFFCQNNFKNVSQNDWNKIINYMKKKRKRKGNEDDNG